MRTSSINRLGRFTNIGVLVVMLLAIVAFARVAQRDPSAPPPTEGFLVVASLRSDQLTFHDFSRDIAASLALPAAPHEFAVYRGRLYATLPRANLLAEIDRRAPGILRLQPIAGEPHGLAADPSGVLYVALGGANALVALDATTLVEIDRWPTGETPHIVALADGVPHVAVARANRLEAIRPTGTATLPLDRLPEALAAVPGLVVAASHLDGTLHLARPITLEPIATIPVGGGPVRILPLDDRTVAVALQEAAAVAIVDLERRQVLRRVPVPARPDGLCQSPNGTYLAVVSNAEDVVTILEIASWRVAARLPVAHGPGACLWLSD
jgi:DNA-binding beta-propeller fold protein YncE